VHRRQGNISGGRRSRSGGETPVERALVIGQARTGVPRDTAW
jgi:hypothetical protein